MSCPCWRALLSALVRAAFRTVLLNYGRTSGISSSGASALLNNRRAFRLIIAERLRVTFFVAAPLLNNRGAFGFAALLRLTIGERFDGKGRSGAPEGQTRALL